jgi:hypothetical protein
MVSENQSHHIQQWSLKMKKLILTAAVLLSAMTAVHAQMTDLERSRDPLYGLTSNEFAGCQMIQYSLDGRALSSWTPFECYRFQWQIHGDEKACYGIVIRAFQNTFATNDVPEETQLNFQSGCAMLIKNTSAKNLPNTSLLFALTQSLRQQEQAK